MQSVAQTEQIRIVTVGHEWGRPWGLMAGEKVHRVKTWRGALASFAVADDSRRLGFCVVSIYRYGITCTCDTARNNVGCPCHHRRAVADLGHVEQIRAEARKGVAR